MTTFVYAALCFFVPGLLFVSDISIKTDTLKIVSSGTNNQIIIDFCQVDSGTLKSDPLPVFGQIKQLGTSNQVEIFPSSTDTLPGINQNKQHIRITQTGKNNRVKIISK